MVTMEELLSEAKDRGASDVHITVGVCPKCRIDGTLRDMNYPPLSPQETEALVMSITSTYHKEILERKGEVDYAYSIQTLGRYRVNIFRQRGTYAAAIRLVDTTIPKPEKLGLPASVVDLTNRKRGMVLFTGPTGSGKSTSLAALMDVINSNYSSHIITLEDPIEYLHTHKKAIVNQREIGLDTQSYADALRVVLREDPDVILVGEMRDLETISIALTAAETGHLVFSTLHTIGAASTIDRIIDVFPPHQQQQTRIQLASVLEAIISQQLIPKADGHGRVAAFEVMIANSAIKNLIREAKTHQAQTIIQTNRKAGMQTMDDALFDLYMRRIISAENAINYAQDPQSLMKKLF